MNRRGFLSGMLKLGAAFAILPPASTYSRIWRAERQWKCILPGKLPAFWLQSTEWTHYYTPEYRDFLETAIIQNFSGPFPDSFALRAEQRLAKQERLQARYDLPKSIVSPFLTMKI